MDIAPHFADKPRLNISHLQKVYDFLERYPGTKSSKVGHILGLQTNVYRYIKLLQEAHLLNEHNQVTSSRTNSRKFEVPSVIEKGIGLGGDFTNLANQIANTAVGEKVPGWDLTREEVIEKIQTYIGRNQADYIEWFKHTQEVFAIGAFITNSFLPFKEMDNVTPIGPEKFK